MYVKINTDHQRFRNIIKGRVKKDLRKYVSNSEMLGIKGKKYISIPVPEIRLPHFEFGKNDQQGVGAGEGKEGDSVGKAGNEPGQGEAGNAEGAHVQEVDITLEEMAEIMGDQMGLPRIQPKGEKNLEALKSKYSSIHNIGPKSLLHFKRTYQEALKRSISTGQYDPENAFVIPQARDFRYRSSKPKTVENNSAVIIFMMDVSGSMGDEQKEIVRTESFWIDTWLRSQYDGIDTRYIVHDAAAHEVDRETFFSTRESGGTIISSAYERCVQLIESHYPPNEWNIYPFHFSDGDNWSTDDSKKCFELLETKILPYSNVFCYGQVESLYGSGQFFRDLNEHFTPEREASDKVITTRIPNKDAIYDSIKTFLNKGY